MPKTHPLPRANDDAPTETPAPPASVTVVADNLLLALGRPANLLQVKVRHLWGDRYRANVFVDSAGSPVIAHSYFLTATKESEIVQSLPPITRKYKKLG